MKTYKSDFKECSEKLRFLLLQYNCVINDQDDNEGFIYLKDRDTGEEEEL